MKITCPKCRSLIPAGRCNVAADVAVCDRCNEMFAMSALVSAGQVADDFDLYDAPRGAWCAEAGSGWQLGATTRSAGACCLVPFMCAWSGGSIGGIYGSQVVNGEFNLLLSLFGIPFLLGTLMLGGLTLMTICGTVHVTLEDDKGRVFTGIGPIGWTRRFDWTAVKAVEEQPANNNQSGNSRCIALVGQTRLQFGSMLTEPRRYYLLQCLRKLLAERSTSNTAIRAGEPRSW
jgi:hypothetical protein